MSKIRKLQDGQARSQAKGARRAEVVTKGLGIAIAQAMKGETIRSRVLELIGHNQPTLEQAKAELIIESGKQQKAVTATGMAKARALKVIQASFSRVKTCVQAIIDGYNVDKIKRATTLAEMYALAVQRGNKRKPKVSKPFTADQFKQWSDRGIRKLTFDIPDTKKATDAELGAYTSGLARLEEHFVKCIGLLAKHEHQTRIPVRQVLGLVAKSKQHMREVRKAA